MMSDESTARIVRSLPEGIPLRNFVARLTRWLVADAHISDGEMKPFPESRAKALLRATDTIDEATLGDFFRLIDSEPGQRMALFELLVDNDLGMQPEVGAMVEPAVSAVDDQPLDWLTTIIAAYARSSGYPLHQLDPALPPGQYSPAGQVLRRSAHFIRRQVQRSATERDKMARKLSAPLSGVPSLEELSPPAQQIAPLPPHFRPPVPERYPEMANETLRIDSQEPVGSSGLTTGEPVVITEADVSPEVEQPNDLIRMPPITISRDQLADETRTPPSPLPSSAVLMPNSTGQSRPSFTVALRQMFGQEELGTTKLRVLVQQYPDGPGYYGLQVRVRCKGIKSYVAGTTDRSGAFLCELPVRLESGLTYDVAVTWPSDLGGNVEEKSITLNADRTQFQLPFYQYSAIQATNADDVD